MMKRTRSVFAITPVSCQFEFHPVGQGLFYSGRINNFHFVYDCGTVSGKSYMNAAIDAYEAPANSKPLDMLIISHFHEDHMNGIRDLLRKTNGVKEVVLPYLSPAERLMVAAEYAIAKGLRSPSVDYTSFLADPAGYFSTSAETVTFILPDEPEDEWGNLGEGGTEEQPEGEGTSVGYGWFPDTVHEKEIYNDPTLRGKKVRLRKHASIFRSSLWSFKLYCPQQRVSREAIEAKLGSLDPPIRVGDRGIKGLTGAISTRLDVLKRIYYQLFDGSSGQNSTSIVCCHGPILPLDNRTGDIRWWADILVAPLLSRSERPTILDNESFPWGPYFFHRRRGEPSQAGCRMPPPFHQMLFGDANPEIDEYKIHFKDELQKISLASLPHHGSWRNWRKDLPEIMPTCSLWVASFGHGNQYRHPDRKVIGAVRNANRKILLCTQVQGWRIGIGGWIGPFRGGPGGSRRRPVRWWLLAVP